MPLASGPSDSTQDPDQLSHAEKHVTNEGHNSIKKTTTGSSSSAKKTNSKQTDTSETKSGHKIDKTFSVFPPESTHDASSEKEGSTTKPTHSGHRSQHTTSSSAELPAEMGVSDQAFEKASPSSGGDPDQPVVVVQEDKPPMVDNGHKETPMAQFVEDVGAEVDIIVDGPDGKKIRKRLDGVLHRDGRREIREKNCYDKLGFSFPLWRKVVIITVIFWVQMSMNFNTSVYPNAIPLISKEKHISLQKVRVSQMLFLVLYAFGCELWAPWSEEFGRWPVMQLSLFFVNIWQILAALAPNFGSICVARALGGLSSAGGSVTLGMVADLWDASDQGYAVAYIVLSSVGGTAIGPVFGGIMQDHINWHWNFWIQLIFGGVVEILHFFLVPETRSTILMDREAKRRRKTGEDTNIYGPGEIKPRRIEYREFLEIWKRPFVMFVTEPIVLCMSLLSGFSDTLIFIFTASIAPIFADGWGFGNTASGLLFVAILVGYFIGYFLHTIDSWRQITVLKKHGETARGAERRLLLLLFLAPLEPIGLFIFAWTSFGKSKGIPWIAPTIAIALVGIANYSIYMATIDYMIMAYGPYSASATGGNGFARDFLAGISAMYSAPLYNNIGKLHYEWASTLLGCLGVIVVMPVYIFYWKGPIIRKRSRFAQTLAADRATADMNDSDEESGTSTTNSTNSSKKGKESV